MVKNGDNKLHKKNIILIADDIITSIPVQESNEEIIDLTNQDSISYYQSQDSVPLIQVKLRKTVYKKLLQAQKLLPNNLSLCVYEGYRSLEYQEEIFIKKFAQLYQQNPKQPYKKLFEQTTRVVSPVVNLNGSINIPPHSTGAAVDVYLINSNGEPIEMGIHPKDSFNDVDGTLCAMDSKKISKEAKLHRQIMAKALKKVGFVNYYTEYWHWSYGDRFWAYHAGAQYAIYGLYRNN